MGVRRGMAAAALLALAACGQPAQSGPRATVSATRPTLPPGDAPAVLAHPTRASAAKGTEIVFELEHRNLPPGAGLVLSLVRDVPDGDRHGWYGATGPLTHTPLPVSGTGRTTFRWNGRDVGCAPADAPMWCPAEVGRYRLHASVFDRSDFPLVGWPDRRPRTLVAEFVSAPFVLTGEPDLAAVEPVLRDATMQSIADRLFAEQGLSHVGGPSPIGRGLRPVGAVAEERGAVCATYEALPPYRGRLRTCTGQQALTEAGLRVTREDVKASGEITWAPGVIPYARAEAAALAAADAPYIPRVRFRTQPTREQLAIPEGVDYQAWSRANPLGSTYLSSDVTDWTYRPDLGAWAFEIAEIMAGGQENARGRFSDKVVVRVDGAGRACIVAVGPYRGPAPADITKDPLPCR